MARSSKTLDEIFQSAGLYAPPAGTGSSALSPGTPTPEGTPSVASTTPQSDQSLVQSTPEAGSSASFTPTPTAGPEELAGVPPGPPPPISRLDTLDQLFVRSGLSRAESRPITSVGEQFVSGVERGVAEIPMLGEMTVATGAGLLGLDQTMQEYAKSAFQRAQEIQQNYGPAEVQSVEEINNFDDFLKWAASTGGESLPSMITMAATGGVTGIAGRLAAQGIITKAGERALIARMAALAARGAGPAGVAGASATMETGQTAMQFTERDPQTGELKVTHPLGVAIAGTTAGLLDLLGPETALLGKLGLAGHAGQRFGDMLFGKLRQTGLLNRIGTAVASGAKSSVFEGLQNEAQQEIQLAAQAILQNYDFLGDDANKQRLNALAGGVVAGLGFGVGAHLLPGGEVPAVPPGPFDVYRVTPADLYGPQGVEPAEGRVAPGLTEYPNTPEEMLAKIQEILDSREELTLQKVPWIGKDKWGEDAQQLSSMIGGSAPEGTPITVGPQGQTTDTGVYREAEHAPGTVIVTGFAGQEAFAQEIHRQVSTWLKEFAPNMRLVVGTGETNTFGESKTTYGHALINIKPDLSALEINPAAYNLNSILGSGRSRKARTDRLALFNTIAHEFGHAVIHSQLLQATPETLRSLLQGYQEHLRRVEANPTPGSVEELVSTPGKSWMGDAFGTSSGNIYSVNENARNYAYSFTEYIAQQVAKYVNAKAIYGRDRIPVEGEGFFKRAVDVLRRFFNKFGKEYLPEQKFSDFLDGLRLRNRYSRRLNEFVRANGRPSPFSEVAPTEGPTIKENITGAYYVPWLYKSITAADIVGPWLARGARSRHMLRLTPEEGKKLVFAFDATKVEGILYPAGDFGVSYTEPDNVAGVRAYRKNFASEEEYQNTLDRIRTIATAEKGWTERALEGNPELGMEFRRDDAMLPKQTVDQVNNSTAHVQQVLDKVAAQWNPHATFEEAVQQQRDDQSLREALTRFGSGMKWLATLSQILKTNRHVRGISEFERALYRWQQTKMRFITNAHERIGEWNGLGKEQSYRLGEFLFYLNEHFDTWPSESEIAQLAHDRGLDDASMEVFAKVKQDFLDMLEEVRTTLIEGANRIRDPLAQVRAVNDINKQFDAYRKKPYFPLSRYGRYTIAVRANRPTIYQGKTYGAGEIMHMESFESERDQKAAMSRIAKEIQGATGREQGASTYSIGPGYIPRDMDVYRGMPVQLLQSLRERLHLSDAQSLLLDEVIFESLPSRSFKHHFRKRSFTPGYSLDAPKAYANYFFHGANFIARVRHDPEFKDALEELKSSIQRVRYGGTGNDPAELEYRRREATVRGRLLEHLTETQNYIMSPSNEFAGLRAGFFHFFLGFSPKSAMINLTQVPIATYSQLGASFGDASAINAIARGYRDLKKYYSENPQGLDPMKQKMFHLGVSQGWLDESQATELAAMAEGGRLHRALAGTQVQRLWRQFGWYSSWMFQQAERINRRVTFGAAYDLALAHPDSKQVADLRNNAGDVIREIAAQQGVSENAALAFLYARQAVETTQGEYARWNRPQLMRGKKGVFFLFKMFTQHMLWMAGNEPGAARYLLLMFGLAGLTGLPFADDAMELAKFIARLGGKHLDVKTELRSLIAETNVNPDIIMHGIARDSFGMTQVAEWMGIPFPAVDMSGSLSMGRIIPGVRALNTIAGGDFNAGAAQLGADVGGAVVSSLMGMVQAAASSDPNTLRRFEKALPSVFRNITRAYRYVRDGGEQSQSGDVIARFNPTDPQQAMEMIAQSLGFAPTRVAQQWERVIAEREIVKFWTLRREYLLRSYDWAHETGDREAVADARRAIRNFNHSVPDGALRISGANIAASRRSRERRRERIARGQYSPRRYTGVIRGVQTAYPPAER